MLVITSLHRIVTVALRFSALWHLSACLLVIQITLSTQPPRISLDPEGICVFIFAHIRAQQAIPKKFRNIVDPAGGRSMYA